MTLLLPILIPLATAALLLVAWKSLTFQRAVSVVGSLGYGAAAIWLFAETDRLGICVVQLGNWPAPIGITFAADTLSTLMVLATALVNLGVSLYTLTGVEGKREQFGYHPLFHVLITGVSGAFLTGDLFNLFVWFEVMLMASFVLLGVGGGRSQVEGALKYVSINLVGSSFFLSGVGLIYGLTGSLNMADLNGRVATAAEANPGLVHAISALFLVAFGIKAAVFPLYSWLPASYPTAPTAIVALFAGLLTKVGIYSLLRVFTLVFGHDPEFWKPVFATISVLTMVTGVLGAYAQNEFRRVLSFHIVSQIGYMTLALALWTPAAISASIFFVLHNIVAKTNLFLVGGVAQRICGTLSLPKMGGLYTRHPLLVAVFLVSALSLAGLPPFAGFWAKLLVVRATFQAEQFWLGAVGLAVGLVTLLSMLKLWTEAFWKPLPEGCHHRPVAPLRMGSMMASTLVFAALAIMMGLAVGPVYRACERAGNQLTDPAPMVRAVMGGAR